MKTDNRGKKYLDNKCKKIIQINIGIMTGFQLSKALSIPEYVVYDYIRYIKKIRLEKSMLMDEKKELSALIKFSSTYSGSMVESLNSRIEFLKSKIKNQKHEKITN